MIAAVLTFGALVGLVLLWRSGQRVTVAIVAGAIAGYEVIYLFVQHDVRYVYPMLWVQSLVAASVPARLLGRVRDRAAVGDTSALPDGTSA